MINENEIKQSVELVSEMKHEMDKYTQLYELSVQNKINTIKKEVGDSYIWFIHPYNKAREWLNLVNNNKVDKKKKYEEQTYYEFLTNQIIARLTDYDIKIIEFIDLFNGGVIAKWIRFECENKIFELCVPLIECLNKSNCANVYDGKLTINVKVSEYTWDFVGSSYNENELKLLFKSYIKENRK